MPGSWIASALQLRHVPAAPNAVALELHLDAPCARAASFATMDRSGS